MSPKSFSMRLCSKHIKESLSTTMHCTLMFVYTYRNCAIKYDNYLRDMISTALPAITVLLESLRK